MSRLMLVIFLLLGTLTPVSAGQDALPCLTSLGAFTPLGALTSPVGRVAALRDFLPTQGVELPQD